MIFENGNEIISKTELNYSDFVLNEDEFEMKYTNGKESEKKQTNLIYEPIYRYKECAYQKLFAVEYGIKGLLESIIENPNSIPLFNAYIIIRQAEGKSYVFKKKDLGSDCECIPFIIDINEATPVGCDISYNPNASYAVFEKMYNTTYKGVSVNLLLDKLCSVLAVKKENLFIHTIYPNYMGVNITDIESLCYLIIETEGYQKYQNLSSFYMALACLYAESLVYDRNYSWSTVDEIIDNAVRDVYTGTNLIPKVAYKSLPYFSIVTRLSSMLYEGGKCQARIIVDEDNNCFADIVLKKTCAFDIQNMREVRKLLEIVNKRDGNNKGQALLIKKSLLEYNLFPRYEVVGIVSTDKYADSPTFIIDDNLSWHFDCKQKTLLRYIKGRYVVRKDEEYDRDLLERKLTAVFKNNKVEQLVMVISEAWKQRHGTTVLITDDVTRDDIIRLCDANRGYEINDLELPLTNDDYTEMITSIDGAVVIDSDCRCYAIGVILDGKTIVDGNMARGARYNSARNYIATLKKMNMKAVAVVISEDRTMDVISTEDICWNDE